MKKAATLAGPRLHKKQASNLPYAGITRIRFVGSRALRALLSAWLTKLPWVLLFSCRPYYRTRRSICQAPSHRECESNQSAMRIAQSTSPPPGRSFHTALVCFSSGPHVVPLGPLHEQGTCHSASLFWRPLVIDRGHFRISLCGLLLGLH
jgi:hypothetical protein